MALPKGLGLLGLLVACCLAASGCFAPGDEDDNVINPNLEAVLTTGTQTGGGSSPGLLARAPCRSAPPRSASPSTRR